MASFSGSLSQLNVFSIRNKNNVHMACKSNYQLFVSDGNVMRTALVDPGKNYFKLLKDSTDFDVKDLKINRLETLLAIIGDEQIKIVSIRSQPSFAETSIWWDAKAMLLGQIQGDVVAAAWHPAMSSGSTLVVLTSVGIFLYDVATSLLSPARAVNFDDQTPNFVGFCFGLAENFAGSMTLYLQAESGALYAIFPFVAHNSPILATKELVTEFLGECAEAQAEIEKKFAPAFVATSRLAEVRRQTAFAEFFAVQLLKPAISELNEEGELQLYHNAEIFDDVIQGPIANVGPLDDIRLVPTNSRVLVLCAVKGGEKVTFNYLAQLKPLIAAYSKPGILKEPRLPDSKETAKKDQKYRPLARGFGFVVDSDDDDVESETSRLDEYAEAMQHYNEELEKYKFEVKLTDFVETNFGSLTVIAKDVIAGHSDLSASFTDSQSSRMTVSTGNNIIVAETKDAIANIWGNFQVAYTKHKTYNAVAHLQLEDKVRDTGEYVIAISPGCATQVIGLNPPEATKKAHVIAPDSAKLGSKISAVADVAALHSQLATIQPVQLQVPKLDVTSPETLKYTLKIRQELASAFMDATMFLFKFQIVAQTQYNELQNQLESVAKQIENLSKGAQFDRMTTKIEVLLERLEQLRSRQSMIISITERKIRAIHASVSLPLSDEERAWFKELNLLSTAISGSSESIEAQFENVKSRFDQMGSMSRNKNSKESTELGNERKLLSGPFSRLKLSLEAQSKAISNLKSQASELTVIANDGILRKNLTSIE